MTRPYDITVYGATGFTGQFAAAEAVRTCIGKKIAIAGRNKAKLEKILDFVKEETGGDIDVHKNVGIIIADSSDEESMQEMCRQSKVIVNCVGPFALYGEQVVKACVENSTHHVDISGEPQYLQMCYLKYHEEAKAKGIHIVGACGFDSVPADVGLETLRETFPGELTAAESYIHTWGPGKVNIGTYNSIIEILSTGSLVKDQMKLIFKDKLPYCGTKLAQKSVGYAKSEHKYFIPFPGADPGVVMRTQLHESSVFGKTPIQYKAYMTVKSLIHLFFLMIFGLYLFIFSKFEMGIKLLKRFPGFFSFGIFSLSEDHMSKEALYKGGFKVVFHGRGYSQKANDAGHLGEPDLAMSLTFKGPDAGYIYTSSSIIAAATTILDDKLANKGGVLTPGSAFRGTGFVDRLLKRNVKIIVN